MAAEIKGIPDFKAKLQEIPKALRRRVLRNALAAGARTVRDEARRLAPVLRAGDLSAPYRTPGTVRKAISVRTSKVARRAGDVGVFVNVRPARAGNRGAKNPKDPFYWRFLEFGTRKMPARSFLRPAASKLKDALSVFETEVVRWINKVDKGGQIK
jgi:HK97 gp10 family phage protein